MVFRIKHFSFNATSLMLTTFAVGFGSIGFSARLSSIDLPQVTSHSPLDLVVNQGDKVHLKLGLSKLSYSFEWKLADKPICYINECVVKTKDMPLGRNQVKVLVRDNLGSREFTFKFEVISREAGIEPKEYTPELVPADPLNEIQYDGEIIRKRLNHSKVYGDQETIIVGEVPRNLSFKEKVETAADSESLIEKEGSFQVIMGKKTKIELQKVGSARIIRLNEGSLRVRALSQFADYELEVACGRKIVRLDPMSDFHCTVAPNQGARSEIINFRGTLKVRDEVSSSMVLMLPVGSLLSPENESVTDYDPRSLQIFKETTPQYFLTATAEKATAFVTQDLKFQKTLGGEEVKKKAKTELEKKDPILALETLLLSYKSLKADGVYNSLVGEAYMQLNFLEEAVVLFDRAIKLIPNDDHTHFLRANAYFLLKNCSKSITSLKKVMDLDNSEELSLVLYQAGYCQYEENKLSQSRLYLRTAIWHTKSESLLAKIEEILKKIQNRSRFAVKGTALVGYDSNVTKTAASHDDVLFAEQLGSSYYSGGVTATYRPMFGDRYTLDLGYEMSTKGYLSDKLADYVINRHQMFTSFEFQTYITSEDKDKFFFKIEPEIEVVSVGENRSGDSYGYQIAGGYRGARSLSVWYGSTTVVDPLPASNDYYDYFSDTAIIPSDRSMILTSLGMRATVFRSGKTEISAGFDQSKFAYSDDSAKESSRTDQDFSLGIDYSTFRSTHNFKLGATTSSFAYLPEVVESSSYLGWGWEYFFTPLLSMEGNLDYESHKSTETVFTYKGYTFSLGCNLEI